jgi:hypothetical protein
VRQIQVWAVIGCLLVTAAGAACRWRHRLFLGFSRLAYETGRAAAAPTLAEQRGEYQQIGQSNPDHVINPIRRARPKTGRAPAFQWLLYHLNLPKKSTENRLLFV